MPRIEGLSRLAELPDEELLSARDELTGFLTGELAAHERADERLLYPAVAKALGGSDPTGPMSRGHAEIAERTRQIGLLCAEADIDPAALPDLRRALHELHAILRLHFTQEEESFYVLADLNGSIEPHRTI